MVDNKNNFPNISRFQSLKKKAFQTIFDFCTLSFPHQTWIFADLAWYIFNPHPTPIPTLTPPPPHLFIHSLSHSPSFHLNSFITLPLFNSIYLITLVFVYPDKNTAGVVQSAFKKHMCFFFTLVAFFSL